ncbi:MAG TPA: MFS transporter, partial [Rhodobacterales bacterium]|nr:MFS transporter [Rhodobacterales bacterium]
VLLASVADVTRAETRTRAMAIVGVSIGFAFMIGLVLGPLVAVVAGMAGIFWFSAALALGGIGLAWVTIPTSETHEAGVGIAPAGLGQLLTNPRLLELDLAIFILHATMTALFLAVPSVLRETLQLDGGSVWMLYLPVLLAAAVLMVPLVIAAEKHGRMNQVRLFAVTLIGVSEALLLMYGTSPIGVVVALVVFFTAFTVLEALLPSLLTRAAPPASKGSASGLYSSAQFIGIFVGGAVGGIAMHNGGARAVFAFVLVLTMLWDVVLWLRLRAGNT